MEHNLKLILLTLLLSHTILVSHALNPCHPQYCESNPLPVRFPFMLQQSPHAQPQSCGYGTDFLLTCSGHEAREVPVLNLPYSGNFSVRYINYLMQEIQLYDADGCLPARLLSLNLTSSPFVATFTNEFIFLSCPRSAVATRFATVDCLGNATSAVMATTSVNLAKEMNMCKIMYTLPIPVSWPAAADGGDWLSSDLGGDLRLTWSFPDCQGCEAQGGVCGYDRNSTNRQITCYFDHERGNRGLEIFKIIALSIVIPAIICSICISCFTCIVERRAARARAATVAAHELSPPPPPAMTTGLDESTIESYTKVVLGESKRLPGPNGVTCPICLIDYSPKDTLRCIPECQHCFHSECVDEWLRLNSSCPVCRNSPARSLEQV